MDQNPGGQFIYVDIGALARKLSLQLTDQERQCIVGVGSSGAEFANLLSCGPPRLLVETTEFNRQREKRRLEVPQFDYKPVVADDIAVSGLTLWFARERISPTPETAAVGMLYKSKTTRRRSGFSDIRAGLVYSRIGGGNPPINSLNTLQLVPERLNALAERYFTESADAFKQIIKEMK